MSIVISVIQVLSAKPWISISFVLPNVSIERPFSACSSGELLPSNRQYGWSVLCMQRSLQPVPRWWFICRVNRKTKPLNILTAKERGRERSVQSDALPRMHLQLQWIRNFTEEYRAGWLIDNQNCHEDTWRSMGCKFRRFMQILLINLAKLYYGTELAWTYANWPYRWFNAEIIHISYHLPVYFRYRHVSCSRWK